MDERYLRIPAGCGVTGIMNRKGEAFSGEWILNSVCNMLERGNGLGSGFAGYGIYPEMKDHWCFHIMYEDRAARYETENYLRSHFEVVLEEPIPTKAVKTLDDPPILWRYFLMLDGENQEDSIVSHVMFINRRIRGAFVFSSGKNMGIFKGVGDPEAIGEFYRIYDYHGYLWIAHNRFPTNTPGWWGGAHPFGILDWSVVHNGEISSYGTNKRFLETWGYYCTLSTDTEVMAYLFDLLVRRHRLDFEVVGKILAAPFWSQIERVEDKRDREFLKALRMVYGPALVNGPFAVIVANSSSMVGLNDRTKLRPLVAATKGDFLYIASEEAAIRVVCRDPDRIWMPKAGEPTIGRLQGNGQA